MAAFWSTGTREEIVSVASFEGYGFRFSSAFRGRGMVPIMLPSPVVTEIRIDKNCTPMYFQSIGNL